MLQRSFWELMGSHVVIGGLFLALFPIVGKDWRLAIPLMICAAGSCVAAIADKLVLAKVSARHQQ